MILSDLQKSILRKAYKNHLQHPEQGVSVLAREVLVAHYGFPSAIDMSTAEHAALVFSRKSIGIKKYQAASVSVAKSFDRLVVKGLARRKYNYGIELTDAGLKLAGELTK